MNNMFSNIRYGNGNRPYCRFWLNDQINAGFIGDIYCIDVVLSESLRYFDVWVVSEQNDRVYYRSIEKRVPSDVANELKSAVSEAVRLTRKCTKKCREENMAPTDMLREEIRKIVSECLVKSINKRLK